MHISFISKMTWCFTSCFIVLGILSRTVQGCLQHSNGPITSLTSPGKSEKAVNQAIITSYHFQCCGLITEWSAYVIMNNDNSHYTIKFQVWRLLFSIKGLYSIVGEDIYDVEEAEDEMYKIIVPSSNNISVQSQDVIGIAAFDNEREIFRPNDGVALNLTSRNQSVRYSRNRTKVFSHQILTGSNGTHRLFADAAPLISIKIATSACQESLGNPPITISTVLPTPTALFTQKTTPTPSPLSSLSTANSLPAGGIGGVVLAVCGFVFLTVVVAIVVTYVAIKKKKSTRAVEVETRLNTQKNETAVYADVPNIASEVCEIEDTTLNPEPVYDEAIAPVLVLTEFTSKTNQAYGCLPDKTKSPTAPGTEDYVEVKPPSKPFSASRPKQAESTTSLQNWKKLEGAPLNQCVKYHTTKGFTKQDPDHLYAMPRKKGMPNSRASLQPSEDNFYMNC